MSISEPRVYVYKFSHPEQSNTVSEYYFYAVSKDLALKQYKKFLAERYDLLRIPKADTLERANDNDKPFVRMEIGDDDR